jgi:hypothetical protein
MTLTEGSRVRFEDENDEPRIGTVLEYSDANDGTGKHVYWIEAGDDIYARGKDEVEPVDGPDEDDD